MFPRAAAQCRAVLPAWGEQNKKCEMRKRQSSVSRLEASFSIFSSLRLIAFSLLRDEKGTTGLSYQKHWHVRRILTSSPTLQRVNFRTSKFRQQMNCSRRSCEKLVRFSFTTYHIRVFRFRPRVQQSPGLRPVVNSVPCAFPQRHAKPASRRATPHDGPLRSQGTDGLHNMAERRLVNAPCNFHCHTVGTIEQASTISKSGASDHAGKRVLCTSRSDSRQYVIFWCGHFDDIFSIM